MFSPTVSSSCSTSLSLSLVSSKSHSAPWIFLPKSLMSASCWSFLELASLVTDSKLAMDVKRVSVSVFKDCIFFLMASMVQDCSAILVYEATKGDELNQVSKMEAWNQRASLDFDAQLPM